MIATNRRGALAGLAAMTIGGPACAAKARRVEAFWNYGQSLSAGRCDGDRRELLYPDPRDIDVLMFNGGVAQFPVPKLGDYSLVPAHEVMVSNPNGFTSDTGACAAGLQLAQGGAQVVVAGFGVGGAPYPDIKRGTASYEAMRSASVKLRTLSTGARVAAVTYIHGESERMISQADYLAELLELSHDLHRDIDPSLVLVHDQCGRMYSAHEVGMPLYRVINPALAQLEAGLSDPGAVCVGPKYWLPFSGISHMTPRSYTAMGSLRGMVLLEHRRLKAKGGKWKPLHFESAKRDGRQIILSAHVPFGKLTVDETTVPRKPFYGFECAAGIEDARIDGNTVILTLAAMPDGPTQIDIAMSGDKSYYQGLRINQRGTYIHTGARSNIRDEAPWKCPITDTALQNWACHQSVSA